MKKLNTKKIISLIIVKKSLEKKLYLVIENNIQKVTKEVVTFNQNSSITKKILTFSDFSYFLDIKKLKLPLFYKIFICCKKLNIYLDFINKKKNILPVLIKVNSLVFKSSKSFNLYSTNDEKVVSKIKLWNTNLFKLVFVLKYIQKI